MFIFCEDLITHNGERELEKYGYEDVLQKYLFGDSEIAKNVFPRIYHGKCGTMDHD